MELAAYILLITTSEIHNIMLVDEILKYCFCCVFSAHGVANTLAVCEDVVTRDKNETTFKYYDNYIQSPFCDLSAVTIQEYTSVEHTSDLIDRVGQMVRANGGAVLISDWY